MNINTEIASSFTVEHYRKIRSKLDDLYELNDEWNKLLDAFDRRIQERFIRPIGELLKHDSNEENSMRPGFSILALDCLLIDTIQSFREGRKSTGEVSPAKSFKDFLKDEMSDFFNHEDRRDFFGDVRNGLFHNGETRGNWKIRKDSYPLIKKEGETRIINRDLFHKQIELAFTKLCTDLKSHDITHRKLFLDRMDDLCGLTVPFHYYFAYGSNMLDSELKRDNIDGEYIGAAFLPNYRLEFTKHSITRQCDAASIRKDSASVVWGAVFRICKESRKKLCEREQGYKEIEIQVFRQIDNNLKQIRAFTFWGESTCSRQCGPSAEYRNVVVKGAESRDLPKDYIDLILR